MAGWFFDRFMDKLFNIGFDQYFEGRTGTKERLERLRVNCRFLQAAASACTQGKIADPELKRCYWLLRDTIDEANDVHDEFEYMKHKEQLELNMEETKVPSLFDRLLEPPRKVRRVCERAVKKNPNLEKLKEAVQKLDIVLDQVSTFRDLVKEEEKDQQGMDQQLYVDRESRSIPGPVFIGRDQEKEIVMGWLSEPSNHNLSLLSIVGHGGMGKTTLVQNIYADERTKEFDLKIWVCVSQGFKVEEVITDMLKYIRKWSSHLTETSLHDRLKSVMRSKKFLLVLDDIWEERTTTKWEKVISLLADGKLGSKILVTTRTDAAASMIPGNIIEKKTRKLNGLEDAQCLELLRTHAFSGKNILQYQKLMGIADKIGKRLSGSPLAAKVIGGILNSNFNESVWMNILHSTNILNVEPRRNSILPILKLSFSFLSQPQKICFAFCGIFPQDHKFDKDDLVRMWIALGFIQEFPTEKDTLEDIGVSYFDALLRNSFFDQFQDFGEIYYKMHDLLHDLAKSISSEECFRFVGGNVSLFRYPETIRHLFVNTDDLTVLRMIKDVKNLHSLFLSSTRHDEDFTKILTEIFEASRSIRLLYIKSPFQKKMSEAIQNLSHLRYLKLDADLTQMPRSLSSLYHLRFIINTNLNIYWDMRPRIDDFLPDDVSNLSNLRHLELPVDVSIRGIGNLRSLQELNEFSVKNENGYRIGELEHMNELRKLKVHFLENVKYVGEAGNAKLFEKRKLSDLLLNWGKTVDDDECTLHMRDRSRLNIIDSDLDLNVLENLQPYESLKRLSIVSYAGARSAEWMYNAVLISNLEYIRLDTCLEWEILPPFGQLPHLKSLYLRNMPKTKRLDYKSHGNDKVSFFPWLEVLHMEGLQVLEDWFDGAAAYDCFFPCLTDLFLDNCPNLKELPYLPPKLKTMGIYSIGWTALNCKQGTSKSIPLETLEVHSCPKITSLLPADVGTLRIKGCPNLISVGGVQQVKSRIENVYIDDPSLFPAISMASFKMLAIRNNDGLLSFTTKAELWFPNVSSSLRELSFENLKSLQSLPSSLECFSSLEKLSVESVPGLQQLPRIPASLKELNLEYLKSLRSLPTSLSATSSLNRLRVFDLPVLESLPDLPSSLDSITVESCDNLQWLSSSWSAISFLKHLTLTRIPLLKSLPELPSSLNSLTLWSLDNLESLPSLSAISSLKDVDLDSIPLLKSLPDLPSSLKSIRIIKCDPELMKRYEKFSGSDWHKIAHIPDVRILRFL